MAKSLKDILQGVKSSKKVTNDLGGYKPKAGDEEDFAKKHEIEKYDDRVGNGDDIYNATNIKHSMEKETRHGHKKPKDEKVYESKMKCEACGGMHEGDSCGCGEKTKEAKSGKKGMIYGDKKVSVDEAWYSEKGGKRTYFKGQREAMRHARSIDGSYGADHGAQGQKASKALGWDAKEKQGLGIGLTSKADKAKAAQKEKAAKKAGPWGLREASVPALLSKLPATASKIGSAIVKKQRPTGALKKTIGTAATVGTGVATNMLLPDKDDGDEDTKKNAPSSAKKDDFPQAGRWRDDDDKKDTTPEREVIPTQHVPVDMPKKEPDEPVFNPKTPESYWDKQSRMKGEIEDAKHKARLKKIEAGEKDDDDEDDEFKPKVIDGVKVRSIFKNKAEKDEHERLAKSSMDPEGPTQKFLKGLRDKEDKENSERDDKFLDKMGVDDSTRKSYKGASHEGKLAALDAMSKASDERMSKLKAAAEKHGLNAPASVLGDSITGKTISKKPENDFDRQAEMPSSDERRKPKAVNEVLSKKADAGEWISDFVHSDNPKFKGKSKEKRKQMALAAYYAKQRNEETVEEGRVLPNLNQKEYEPEHSKEYLARVEKEKAAKQAKKDSKNQGWKGYVKTGSKAWKPGLDEAVTTGNEGHGYHGEAYGAATSDNKMAEAGKAYAKAHALVKQHAAEHLKGVKDPDTMVKHYLDSQYGRHLHGNEHDASYVKKDFAHFKKKYKPEMHEEIDLEEADLKKMPTHKLQALWDKHKDEERPAPTFAAHLKRVNAELTRRKKMTNENLAVPLLGGMTAKDLKKKMKKEQTGPDTPLTLPNMSVDVNTGRNV